MRHAIHPRSLLRAMLPFVLFQWRPHREPLTRRCSGCRRTRRRAACKRPVCGVPPKARYPEMHRGARLESQMQAVTVPVNRARCSGPRHAQSFAALLPTRRCPWLQSNNRQSSASPADDPGFRGRPRCVPDKRAGPGKLLPKDFPIPSAATAPLFLRRHETGAPQANGSRSSASES